MDDWLQNPYMLICFKLIAMRQKQTNDALNRLEEELRKENRFFPRNKILEKIDGLVEAPHRILQPGTTIYRARTIDKYYEEKFFAPLSNDFYTLIKEVMPDIQINMDIDTYDIIQIARFLDKHEDKVWLWNEKMEKLFEKYGQKGWWGYDKENSDAPPVGMAGNGRINPKGISYLYAADNRQTAALEVRPVVSQYVSIAEVKIERPVQLFDFTCNYEDAKDGLHADQTTDLTVLGSRFAQPNYSGEDTYLVTQYISEYIKHLKDKSGENVFDGLCFKSSLDDKGCNYVLFDVTTPKYSIINSSVYQVLDLIGNLQLQLPLIEEKAIESYFKN